MGLGRDPGGGVDGLPVEVVALVDHLAGVEADPDLDVGEVQPVVGERPLGGDGAGQCPPGRPEGDHEAVPQRLHLEAAVGPNLAPHEVLVGPQQLLGDLVAVPGADVGRRLDVGEEDRDRAAGQRLELRHRWRAGSGDGGGVRHDGGGSGRGGRGWRLGRRRGPPVELRCLPEDAALQRRQRRARVEADLLGQELPEVAIGPEGLDLPAGAVERQHPLSPQPFPERVGPRQGVELGGQLGVAAAGQLGLNPLLGGRAMGASATSARAGPRHSASASRSVVAA